MGGSGTGSVSVGTSGACGLVDLAMIGPGSARVLCGVARCRRILQAIPNVPAETLRAMLFLVLDTVEALSLALDRLEQAATETLNDSHGGGHKKP